MDVNRSGKIHQKRKALLSNFITDHTEAEQNISAQSCAQQNTENNHTQKWASTQAQQLHNHQASVTEAGWGYTLFCLRQCDSCLHVWLREVQWETCKKKTNKQTAEKCFQGDPEKWRTCLALCCLTVSAVGNKIKYINNVFVLFSKSYSLHYSLAYL